MFVLAEVHEFPRSPIQWFDRVRDPELLVKALIRCVKCLLRPVRHEVDSFAGADRARVLDCGPALLCQRQNPVHIQSIKTRRGVLTVRPRCSYTKPESPRSVPHVRAIIVGDKRLIASVIRLLCFPYVHGPSESCCRRR